MEAFLFDLDGVIVDNHDYHEQAWNTFFKKYDIDKDASTFLNKHMGKRNDQIMHALFPDKPPEIRQELAAEKEAIYRELYEDNIKPTPGLKDVLETSPMRHGVATSAPPKNLQFVLQALNLNQYFDATLHGHDVDNPKPNPEIYKALASQLNTPPKQCLVFEDSTYGIQAGNNAGMTTIAVLTKHDEENLPAADGYINDFTEVDWL